MHKTHLWYICVSKIPGDIISDLRRAEIISNPYYEMNWLTQRRTWMGELNIDAEVLDSQNRTNMGKNYNIPGLEVRTRTWIYETNFEITRSNVSHFRETGNLRSERMLMSRKPKYSIPNSYNLIVEGIKMGAAIYVNGVHVGNATDQFLRYIFPIPPEALVDEETQTLAVIFDPSIDTHGRFMACSGGWDWAPYSLAGDMSLHSRRVFSFGISKPIYVAEIHHVSIVHVVPKIYYLGSYSEDSTMIDEDFELRVEIFLQLQNISPLEARNTNLITFGEIIIKSDIFRAERIPMRKNFVRKENEMVVIFRKRIPRKSVELWWPNGAGAHQLYTLSVQYHNRMFHTKTNWVRKRIGKSIS